MNGEANAGDEKENNKDFGKPREWLETLGVTIHEILRYGWGGVLAFFIAGVTHPTATNNVLKVLQPTVVTLTAFIIGAAVYALHRAVLGEVFYLVSEWLHSSLCGGDCRSKYLMQFQSASSGASYWRRVVDATEAFRTVRDSDLFDTKVRNRFRLQHTEQHMVYIAAWVLIFGAIAAKFTPGYEAPCYVFWFLITAGILIAIISLYGDIRICRQEYHYLATLEKSRIEELLQKANHA